MQTNIYSSGRQSVTASIGGGAANRGLTLQRGMAALISIRIADRHRRPFNPSDPYYFKAIGSRPPDDENLTYALEAYMFDPRSQESFPVARFELADSNFLNRSADDIEDGRFDLELNAEQLNRFLPGFYELGFRLVGTTIKNNCETIVTDEFLGINLDGSGRLPVRLEAGILPIAREPITIEFHKENFDRERQGVTQTFRYICHAVDAGANRNRRTSMHTIAVYHSRNFQGTLHAEGSLADHPAEADWFPIPFNGGKETKEWRITNKLHANTIEAFHFRISVRKFRFYWLPNIIEPQLGDMQNKISGMITKILLRS